MTLHYRYSAREWNGQPVKGKLSADSKTEALEMLQKRNLITTALRREQTYLADFKIFIAYSLSQVGYRPYSSRDLMIFCRQMAAMLGAGLTILRCLKVLAGQIENAALKAALINLAAEVEGGSSLHEALGGKKHSFPPVLIHMVEAGETGGMLVEVMERMAVHFEKQHDLEEKIRSATLYPAFIILVAIAVIAIMITFVLPQFALIFDSMGIKLPFYSRALFTLGTLAGRYSLLLLIFFAALAASALLYAKTPKGRMRYDRLRLILPLFGRIYRQTLAARFARTLGTLLAGGVTLHASLSLIGKIVDNAAIEESIARLNAAVGSGETIAAPLKEAGYFPPLMAEMVRIGEETGALAQTLQSTAAYYEKEVSYTVERLSTVLEPAILLVVGTFIGLIVFSILSPMYRIFEMI